jgi:hypothetical protein
MASRRVTESETALYTPDKLVQKQDSQLTTGKPETWAVQREKSKGSQLWMGA